MSDGGLSSFQRRMRAIPEAVRRAVGPSLVAAAEQVADAQRALAPVDEGDLRASIAVTGPGQATPPYSQPGGSALVPENAAAVTVGSSEVRYPHLQEFGTTFHPAQPFFWPGFRLSRKAALAKIKRSIGKAIRGTGGKK
jgi:HK97 gp10 family phage protein